MLKKLIIDNGDNPIILRYLPSPMIMWDCYYSKYPVNGDLHMVDPLYAKQLFTGHCMEKQNEIN